MMLTVLGSEQHTPQGLTRREALKAGVLSALGGLSLPQLLAAEESNPVLVQKAKHVVCVYLLGGAATQDMYDLKPSAPTGVRGDFKPIATSAPGVRICEHLPKLARWMHRAALIRSVTHKAGCHNPIPSYTGSELMPIDIISTRDSYPPSMGSVCEYLRQNGVRGKRPVDLPDYVYMPCYLGWGQAIRRPGPYAGFLGKQYDALDTECAPFLDKGCICAPGQPQIVRGHPRLPEPPAGSITLDRLKGRQSLLAQFEKELPRASASITTGTYDRQQQRAFQLLTSSTVRSAFDLDREPAVVRDAYGRTLFGSSMLVARRLIEAGVRFVNVTWDIYWDRYKIDYDGWDTHQKNFMILKDWNLPQFDQTMSALFADLEARGLLDETLILVSSEMGRTPRVNGAAGRDHWTHCYGNLLAGAGIRGGSICGSSDAQAAYVKDRPVRPADVCATIYHCLGIDPDMPVYDRTGRPIPIAQGGEPIREILT